MEKSLLIAGFGGQGIMTLGQIIGYAATKSHLKATYYPSYGAEQRGGTANCTVVIADQEIGSPVRNKLNHIIVMNEPSFKRFEDNLIDQGIFFINSSLIKTEVKNEKASVYNIAASELAMDIASIHSTNFVMLGAYIAVTKILDKNIVAESIDDYFTHKKEIAKISLIAFDEGFSQISKKGATECHDTTFK